MRPRFGRSKRHRGLLAAIVALSAGCAAGRTNLDQALLADRGMAAPAGEAIRLYRVHCPDVLDLTVRGDAASSGRRVVGPDGRIGVGELHVRVADQTTDEVAAAVAVQLGVPPEQVRVAVAEFNSQQIYLLGEVTGQQRALPYRGPETVLDLLRRAGGITPGAAPRDVQVVRAHVADGKTPEIFHIDLEAIVLKKYRRGNIVLEPFDRIYVGQTQRSQLDPCFPPWLRPVYQTICGTHRTGPDASTSSPTP
jgi:protein involved in polysaccharide export with SLBB domain